MVELKIPDKNHSSWYRKTRQSLISEALNRDEFFQNLNQFVLKPKQPEEMKDLLKQNLLLYRLHILIFYLLS